MADSEFNLATLWLPVAPETSKVGPAMEEAGKQAKTKFGAGVKGIGDTIHDDLAKAGTKAKDAFSGVSRHIHDAMAKAGSDGARSMSTSFNDAFSKIPGSEKVTEPLRKLTDSANQAKASVQNLGDAFSSLKSGDVSGSLERAHSAITGIDDAAKNAGVDLKGMGVPATLTDGLTKAKDTSDQLTTHISEAKDGIDRLGQSGGGLSGLVGKLGEVGTIAAAVVAALNSIKDADHWLENKMPGYKDLDEQFKNNPLNKFFSDQFGDHPPEQSKPFFDPQGRPLDASGKPFGPTDEWDPTWGPRPRPSAGGGSLGGSWWATPPPSSSPPSSSLPYPTTRPPGSTPHNFYKDWYGSEPAPEPAPSAPAPASSPSGRSSGSRGSGTGGIGNPTDRAGLHAAGSRVANLYAFAQSLVGTPYSQQLRNDCSGMVSQLASVALGLPPPSAGQRFSTPNEGDWLMSHGFKEGMGPPGSLRIGWYDHGGGNAGHTAATLPGGEHAESGGSHGAFLVGPGAAGADDPQFEHHAYLPMDGSGRSQMAGESGPLGSQHDPIYTAQADKDSGGGDSSAQSQGQQLGQGLVSGMMEMFGLDGSVFKGFGGGKSILDFGALKLGSGLLNWGMGLSQQRGGGGGGAGAVGGDGAILPGLGALIPGIGGLSPGAAISAGAVPTGGMKTADPAGGGGTTIINGDVNPYNVHGVGTVQEQKEQFNSSNRYNMTVPNAGGGPLP